MATAKKATKRQPDSQALKRDLPTAKEFPLEFAPVIRRRLRWYIGLDSHCGNVVRQTEIGGWQVWSRRWGLQSLRQWAYRVLYEYGAVWEECMVQR